MSIERYNKIVKKNTSFSPVRIKTFKPIPNDFDYKRGYITRYFVQKINDKNAPIYEIDQFGYDTFGNNPFYQTAAIDWKIIGNDEQIKDANSKSILLGVTKIKSLSLYLPNLLQFRKQKD
jgi:hypothetical protein